MRSDYLRVTAQTVMDFSTNPGIAIASLSPDVGQYWTPKVVKVSSTMNPTSLYLGSGEQPYCALYHTVSGAKPLQGVTGIGTANVKIGTADLTALVDDTMYGGFDSTGVLSGTVIFPGESISARWTQGSNSSSVQCMLEVFGETSDTPPALGSSVPSVMGPHFSGKPQYKAPWEIPATSLAFGFNNPGAGLTSAIIPDPGNGYVLYLHTMSWTWTATNSTGFGSFQTTAGVNVGNDFPSTSPRYMDFKGIYKPAGGVTGGLQFIQAGVLAAGSATCFGMVTYSIGPNYVI